LIFNKEPYKADSFLDNLASQDPQMSEVKEFEETEKVGGKLFFVPEEVEIMQTLGDEKEIGDEKLVKQLNAIVVGMSALIVLYTLWIAQRVYVRWIYDRERSQNPKFILSCILAVICPKCSTAQMAVQLDDGSFYTALKEPNIV